MRFPRNGCASSQELVPSDTIHPHCATLPTVLLSLAPSSATYKVGRPALSISPRLVKGPHLPKACSRTPFHSV